MQEAIMQIGNAILDEGSMLLNLVKDLEPIKNKKTLHVLKFLFDTNSLKLKLDCNEEMGQDTAKRYLFIGSAPGANSPQWYATTSNTLYHITETIANIESKVDLGEELNNKIKLIKENFYLDLGSEFKSPKNRYILDFQKFGISEKSGLQVLEDAKKKKEGEDQEPSQKDIKNYLKKTFQSQLDSYLKNNYGIPLKEIGLYVIYIDGKPLCDYENYKKAILKEKSVWEEQEQNTVNYCSMCGSEKKLTSKFDTELKFYTTNQLIFANNLDKNNYINNYSLCEICMNKVLVAEKYIMNNLSTRLANFTVYLLPEFIIGQPMNREDLDDCSKVIKNSFNTVVNYESIESLKDAIDDFISYERDNDTFYLLNILFYKKSQKSTKVQKLIKDINPSIFIEIQSAIRKIDDEFREFFGDKFSRKFSLGKIYYLVPIRVKSGEITEYRKLLSLYEAILLKQEVKKNIIINSINECCKALYFKQACLNVTDNGSKNITLDDKLAASKMIGTIIDGLMFIRFLEKLGCLREGNPVDVSELILDEEMKKFISDMRYNEQQTSLFLLGNLIGAIGNAQYKRSTEGKKPILNKLNFNGMDKSKLIRLSNEVFDKLVQEKILSYNEVIYSQFKSLFDRNYPKWKLNKDENLFYILSGYGYCTNKAIMNKKGGNDYE